jgi:ABC-type multidrug transport system fused ATPase/permease subunit
LSPFKLVFSYARKYLAALVITVVSMLVLVAFGWIFVLIIKTLIAAVTSGNSLPQVMPTITRLTAIVLVVYLARAG